MNGPDERVLALTAELEEANHLIDALRARAHRLNIEVRLREGRIGELTEEVNRLQTDEPDDDN